MAKIDVKIEDHKAEILEAMKEQLAGALEAIGADAASTAADKAPADTGNLKNSIGHAVDGNTVYIGTNVSYAVYHELGTGIYAEQGGRQTPWKYQDRNGNWHTTHGVPARHFLQFGVQAHAAEYGEIIKNALSE
jgi:phage gpG-like protein